MKASSRTRRLVVLGGLALIVFAGLWYQSDRDAAELDEPVVWTGYTLFGLLIFLFLFQSRKRLSMVPFGRSAVWLGLHATGGVLALAVFWLHTGGLWPSGAYEQALATLFYLVSLSGLVGYAMLFFYPKRLVQRDIEVIYERIPGIVGDLRAAAEDTVLACTEATGSDTLSRYYLETFHWFFQRPRFVWSHVADADLGDHWIRQQTTIVGRYLDSAERPYLDKLKEIAFLKNKVDFHYAVQSLMKGWLFVHVPVAAAVVIMAIWHLVVVNVYAL